MTTERIAIIAWAAVEVAALVTGHEEAAICGLLLAFVYGYAITHPAE